MNVDFMCASVDHISCTSQAIIILMVCKFVRLIETLKKKTLFESESTLLAKFEHTRILLQV